MCEINDASAIYIAFQLEICMYVCMYVPQLLDNRILHLRYQWFYTHVFIIIIIVYVCLFFYKCLLYVC